MTTITSTPRPRWKSLRRAALTAVLAVLLASHVVADDRELLRETLDDPYVFILFDTSGSMNWSPKCTQEELDAGDCNFLCPTGDCHVPLNGDDPNSKFVQAKEALGEVLNSVSDVNFGFASFNQNDLRVFDKHFFYRVTSTGADLIQLQSGRPYPDTGDQHVFGDTIGCGAGCPDTADLDDAWEVERVNRFAKLGRTGGSTVTYYIRDPADGRRYRIRFFALGGGQSVGSSTLTVTIDIDRCDNADCSSRTDIGQKTLSFERVSEFISWDNGADRTAPQNGFFTQGEASDAEARDTCGSTDSGWDSNYDSSSDDYTDGNGNNYNLRWATDTSDPRNSYFDIGDVIPWDWLTDHKAEILARLAPNGVNFTSAVYFEDSRTGTRQFLRLKDEARRPLIPDGSTPLGRSMRAFRDWYDGWAQTAINSDGSFLCRKKYLLVLTDGDDTCGGNDACFEATALSSRGIGTFVVAYGVDNTALNPGNKLTCMATAQVDPNEPAAPIFPQNKQDLVDALTSIFENLREQTRNFASAAVPSVQADISDKLFISRFEPINEGAFWAGHIDAFIKPLPLNDDNTPASSPTDPNYRSCGAFPSACHLYDVGTRMLAQGTTLGVDNSSRRVFYAQAPVGSAAPQLVPFEAPTNYSDQLDLFDGLGLDYVVGDSGSEAAALTKATSIIDRTMSHKTAEVDVFDSNGNKIGTRTITYVLGDIFHADPLYVDRPTSFKYFAPDAYNDGDPDTDCQLALSGREPGYRCFSDRLQRRRKMLMIATNDGQLHAFDTGRWLQDDPVEFSDGTGLELFSFVPRWALPILRQQARPAQKKQIFSVDGSPRFWDVFIDPTTNGTGTREWRTVVIGGGRETGFDLSQDRVMAHEAGLEPVRGGYYALDVTQPDILNDDFQPNGSELDAYPSCLTLSRSIPTSCGQVPFPHLLWEFLDESPSTGLALDEDGNGYADLGDPWSVPIVGRVRLATGQPFPNNEEDRFVAIFGGGMDPENKSSPRKGTWLYMVDVETGDVLYKRSVLGSVPSNITAQDRDQNGYLDTLFFGTTAGYLYKVDLRAVVQPVAATADDVAGNTAAVTRITDSAWTPFAIFRTGPPGDPQPIFHPPTAFLVSQLGQFALGFGTGDREDLWNQSYGEGRFYFILDADFTAASLSLPRTETSYRRVAPGDADAAQGDNFLQSHGGWYIPLEEDERVIVTAQGLASVIFFTSFQPVTETLDDQGNPFCSRGGTSRIFLVRATNVNGVYPTGDRDEGFVGVFAPPPFVEQVHTQNEASQGQGKTIEDLISGQQELLNSIKDLYPKNVRFGNYFYALVPQSSTTQLLQPIPIPIGIISKNWTEF